MPTLMGKKTIFQSISSLIFRQKMDGPNLSQMDIKVSNPAPTYCLQSKKVISMNGKRKKHFLSWEK